MVTTITYNTSYLLISFALNDNRMVSPDCNISQLNDIITINDKFLNNPIQLDYTTVTGEVSALGLFNKLIAWKETTSSGGGGTIADAEYKSPIDFSTQRYSASQLTLSNLNIPIINSSQLKYIIKTNSANTETEVLTNGSGSVSLIWNAANSRIDIKKNGMPYPLFDIGTGLTITTTVTAGVITGGTIIAGGIGYYTGGIVLVAGGTGGYFTITSTNGVVTDITLLAGGSGYTTAVAAETSMYSYALDVATVVGIDGQEKAYDPTTDSNKSFVNNYPVQPIQLDLLDSTNVTAGTNYYPSSDGIDMNIYNNFSLSGYILDADGIITMTLEGTNDEDLTTGDWNTIYAYNLMTNAQEVSWAVTNAGLYFALILKDCKFNNIRVKVVNNGATNTMRLKGRLTY